MTETRENLCRINWRMSGDLRALFRQFSDSAAATTLRAAGAGIVHDAQANIAAKGWHRFGTAISQSLNTQAHGRTLEVGASHAAAGMRHFGGTISAPGKGPGAIPAKALTIPRKGSPAEGRTTRDLKAMGWTIFRPKGKRFLLGKKAGDKEATYLFTLAKSVKHPASPWFPTFAQITRRVEEAFRAQL